MFSEYIYSYSEPENYQSTLNISIFTFCYPHPIGFTKVSCVSFLFSPFYGFKYLCALIFTPHRHTKL